MLLHSRTILIAAVFALVGAACTTAGTQLENTSPDSLQFAPEDGQDQPVTEAIDAEEPAAGPEIDPAIAGPEFEVSTADLTLAISGTDGVWWFDANGVAQLVVEPARAADYDGSGGLVFQRSGDSPIVRRAVDAVENDVVAPADGERLQLIGVAQMSGGREAIYLRLTGESAILERAPLDGGSASVIADVARDGVAPQRMSISNGYVSGVYLEGAGAGWVTLSLATGQKLFGTLDGSLGTCAGRTTGCAQAVTIGNDGTKVYQVMSGDDPETWELVVNNASNFASLASIDLQRPEGGWHPTRVEVAGEWVVVSRSAKADGTGDLPALVVDPVAGSITQLDRYGNTVAITG